MSENCCYSFHDLFRAVYGRDWTDTERDRFSCLSQDEKNASVREMVARTNGLWTCEDRVWTDGVTYTAFWRTGSPAESSR